KCWDEGYGGSWVEGYDFGMAAASCYMLAYVDPRGNVLVCDGFYQKEMLLRDQVIEIAKIRRNWGVDPSILVSYAEPDIFRRRAAGKNVVGKTISDMFLEESNGTI